MNLDEIQQIFFQECEEGLSTLEASFGALKDDLGDGETINTIFRSVHSIKGGAGAFGHERLQHYTHQYETLLDLVRNGTLPLTPELLGIIVGAFDMLADHVEAARDGYDAPADAAVLARLVTAASASLAPVPAVVEVEATVAIVPTDDDGFDDLFAMFDDGDGTAEDAPETDTLPWLVRYTPDEAALDHGAEPLLLLRELTGLGGAVVAVDMAALSALADLIPDRSYLGWSVSIPGSVEEDEIRAVFDFVEQSEFSVTRGVAEADVPVQPVVVAEPIVAERVVAEAVAVVPVILTPVAETAPRAAATAASPTIRVDLDKLDRLVNLVGELVITQAMLAQRLSESGLTNISELSDLDHLTRDLQESTMAIRAQPMKTVFSRVPRIIRELELETGKQVRLEVEGEMTEVDKTVVERIGEPLTHLIRNAVDHGLETPDERVAAGKPVEGVVRLSAAHQSGRIVITVADDGRGIDRARVRAKAVERGIIAPDASLSDEDIDNLIFAPGFSTAATVSSISGRGVGMDVVRKNVQALGGRIGIHSQFGTGSSFSLSLPLTLAVLDGMIVAVGDQTFVIPLTHIVESLRPKAGDVRAMDPGAGLLNVRGAYVPVHRVAEQLGIEGAATDPMNAVLIVVESGHGQAVLMVDNIQDQRQVVVKSLESNYHAIPGLAGATILGDGRVALILDVDALISRWRRDGRMGTPIASPIAIAA